MRGIASAKQNVCVDMFANQRLRSACVFTQSDQSLVGALWVAKDFFSLLKNTQAIAANGLFAHAINTKIA